MTFDTTTNDRYLMTVNNLAAGVNMPTAYKGDGRNQLPPYHRRGAFLVDEYPACPTDWPRSSGRIKSYFVPYRAEAGLWLDFNDCLRTISQHVAIVVSVQGVNAITGLPCQDAQLQQYIDQCPKHQEPFGPDRFCKKCNYKWPKQNYLNSTGTPHGLLWLDGFRAEDGTIRQYVFTEKESRGVAAAIIGKDRVQALGISFFVSKTQRPAPPPPSRSQFVASASMGHTLGLIGSSDFDDSLKDTCSFMSVTNSVGETGLSGPIGPSGPSGSVQYTAGPPEKVSPTPEVMALREKTGAGYMTCKKALEAADGNALIAINLMQKQGTAGASKGLEHPGVYTRERDHSKMMLCSASASKGRTMSAPVKVKQMEIAAGCEIDQRIYDDPFGLDYWQGEPEGILVINYCSEDEARAIIEAGKVDVTGSPEGYLQNVPVGNP